MVSVLAMGHWYTSGTTISVASALVIGVVGAAVAWRAGFPPKKLLTYRLSEPTSLVGSESLGPARADLTVTYSGAELSNPYVVTLYAESRSRRDIRSVDFDQGEPLVFDLDAKILAVVGTDLSRPSAGAFNIDGNRVKLSPRLIRRGQLLRISLLTDGEPKLTCVNPLADVEVQLNTESRGRITFNFSWQAIIGALVVLLLYSFFVYVTVRRPGLSWLLVLGLLMGEPFVILIGAMLGTWIGKRTLLPPGLDINVGGVHLGRSRKNRT
jgi:hypothetical protein